LLFRKPAALADGEVKKKLLFAPTRFSSTLLLIEKFTAKQQLPVPQSLQTRWHNQTVFTQSTSPSLLEVAQ
jgi:hypothetical protein